MFPALPSLLHILQLPRQSIASMSPWKPPLPISLAGLPTCPAQLDSQRFRDQEHPRAQPRSTVLGPKMTSEVQYVPSGCPLVLSALRSQHLLQAETSVPRDENLLTAPPGCQSHQIDLLRWKRLFFSFLLPFLPSWQLSKICMQIKAVCSKGTNFINNALCYHWCPHSLCSFLNTDWFCAAHCIRVWASLLLY